ncbi:MAG: flagellar protein FlbB [Rhodospirillales bacterium]|nr:flagellar protein FlbB [Alphaproteobacteria bacterium]USO04610.1 MAG: flagellar protein FlbB [Rhodospirillales bacterium]
MLVLFLALSFGVRFGELVTGKSGSLTSGGFAYAKEEPAVPSEEASPPSQDELSSEEGAHEALPEEHAGEGQDGAETEEKAEAEEKTHEGKEGEKWKDSMDSNLEFSATKMELFQDLSSRRDDLESRERELVMREALLRAAEQEIDQKYKELISLREEIQSLLKTQSEEEEKRIASLVKIYEGMKAKSAARIFDTLDMGVLLQVLGQMSERKSAPIIAAMNPERARSVTIMLAEQRKLPDLSEGALR